MKLEKQWRVIQDIKKDNKDPLSPCSRNEDSGEKRVELFERAMWSNYEKHELWGSDRSSFES